MIIGDPLKIEFFTANRTGKTGKMNTRKYPAPETFIFKKKKKIKVSEAGQLRVFIFNW